MIYAPVIIPTLCRYDHFVKCVESLRKNTWAQYTDVYIGLDYPTKDAHREGYEKIKEYIQQDFNGFKQFSVFVREKNYGAYANIMDLITYCCDRYDRYICMEDDIECSPNFLEYMDLALEKYKQDESVIAVTGYKAPIDLVYSEGATAIKQQLQANTWGIGRWKDKTENLKKYLHYSGLEKKFVDTYRSGRIHQMTNWAIKDYVSMVSHGVSKNSILKQITDVSTRIMLTVEDKYVIMPTVSKTRNLGFDGSGVYCPQVITSADDGITSVNYDYAHQAIDYSKDFELMVDEQFDNEINRKIYNQFDVVDPKEMEILMKDAENYCNHSAIWRKAQNIKSLANSVINKIKR